MRTWGTARWYHAVSPEYVVEHGWKWVAGALLVALAVRGML